MKPETQIRANWRRQNNKRDGGIGKLPIPSASATTFNRLLKNRFREGWAYNPLRGKVMLHAFHSASLVASARFSAAC
jgi:hypothetical protein